MEQPLGLLLRGSQPRCVSYDELFMGSSRVHALVLPSLVVLSLPLASHHTHQSYHVH